MASSAPSGAGSPKRLHPLLVVTASAILIASLTAVAAITGVLPLASSSNSQTGQSQQAQLASNPGMTGSAASAPIDNATPPAQADAHAATQAAAQVNAQADTHAAATQAAAPSIQADTSSAPGTPSQAQTGSGQYAAGPSIAAPSVAAGNNGYATAPPPPASCRGCGTIVSIQEVRHEGQGTGVGAVGGALAGGLVGNLFGAGGGRAAMTVLGAVGGGFAGNTVEKHLRGEVSYQVRVRTDEGHTRYFNYKEPPPYQQGERIRVGKAGIEGSI